MTERFIKIRNALVVIVTVIAIWLIFPFGLFSQVDSLTFILIPYTVLFFTLLFILLLTVMKRVNKKPLFIVLTIGAAFGQFASQLSCFVAFLFAPNGIDRMIYQVKRHGIMDLLIADFLSALFFGGWLFGIIAFGLSYFIFKRWGARLIK